MTKYETTSEIPRRIPSIDAKQTETFRANEIIRQWALITETIRQQLATHPAVREILVSFSGEPLSESLPSQLLFKLSQFDMRIARLSYRFAAVLGAYLKLPAVPHHLLVPDISHAPTLHSPEREVEILSAIYAHKPEKFKERLQHYIDKGYFFAGVNSEERALVATRYRFARDIKLFALGAELIESDIRTIRPGGKLKLPSGIEIGIDTQKAELAIDLLTPHLWQWRKQIKDRVHEISIGGKKYILKERKTPLHLHTKKGGHTDGRTSEEEFSVAQKLHHKARFTEGSVCVDWEQAVGFVCYPDGFQFLIFEQATGLIQGDAIGPLATAIAEHKDQFSHEFELVKQKLAVNSVIPTNIGASEQKPNQQLGSSNSTNNEHFQLSFEDFTIVKALRMQRQARTLMDKAIAKAGYMNDDFDGFAYRIKTEKELQLEIFGFDFEYFREIGADEVTRTLGVYEEIDREIELKQGIGFISWDTGQRVTEVQEAAYFALLEISK